MVTRDILRVGLCFLDIYPRKNGLDILAPLAYDEFVIRKLDPKQQIKSMSNSIASVVSVGTNVGMIGVFGFGRFFFIFRSVRLAV
jgi:hypothetical protein